MGITLLFFIVLLIVVLIVINIPKLPLMKKILIVASVLILMSGIIAYIFITGFERERSPKLEDPEKIGKQYKIHKSNDSVWSASAKK